MSLLHIGLQWHFRRNLLNAVSAGTNGEWIVGRQDVQENNIDLVEACLPVIYSSLVPALTTFSGFLLKHH